MTDWKTDWKRFTPAARRAIAEAEAFARRHGEVDRFPDPELVLGLVGADHLLVGVAHPAVAPELWASLGLDAAEIYEALAQGLTGGVWPPAPTEEAPVARTDPADVLLDESAQQALEYAAAEARRLRHPDIRPAHLLLGALRVGRSGRDAPESLGSLVLTTQDVTLPRVFAVLLAADAAAGTGRYAPTPLLFEP